SNQKRSGTVNKFSDQNHRTESGSNTADERFSRRGVLKAGIAAGAGVAALAFGQGQSPAQSQPGKTTLSDHTMVLDRKDTALVVVDPQNEVLSEKGLIWALTGESVKENRTVENLVRLFKAAKDQGYGVLISPHYLYPTDQAWQFGGEVEREMLEGKEVWRSGPLSLTGFPGSGADWLERFKPYGRPDVLPRRRHRARGQGAGGSVGVGDHVALICRTRRRTRPGSQSRPRAVSRVVRRRACGV